MKERITYVVDKPEEFSPEQLSLKHAGETGPRFVINGVHAAKEHRITLGLTELPEELSKVFRQWHELHIRWTSSASFTVTPPFTSRVSPGLHVFFTPLDSTPEDALCAQLHSVISVDLKCSSTNESAIKLPLLSESHSISTTSQYYAYLESLKTVVEKIAKQFCKSSHGFCQRMAQELSTATSLDVDYDTASRAVVLTATWSASPDVEGWTENIVVSQQDAVVEIGVLSHEPNADPEDIQFGGFLTVLGQDTAPKATRFQTSARHYPLLDTNSPSLTPQPHPLTYTTSFSQPTGLHPTLILSFPKQHLTPPNPSCKLHTYLTLPSSLFIDKYQFNDALFLSSKHLTRLASLAGATDLEAPDWVVPAWGSAALFHLSHPVAAAAASSASDERWNVSIPLHLRYLPASPTSHVRVPLPWPIVFWACHADQADMMAANPFDRVHLGYEALFERETRFMHVQPALGNNSTAAGRLVEWIDVPVLDTRTSWWVEGGTVGVVLIAFFGLCWVLVGGRDGRAKVVERKKKQ